MIIIVLFGKRSNIYVNVILLKKIYLKKKKISEMKFFKQVNCQTNTNINLSVLYECSIIRISLKPPPPPPQDVPIMISISHGDIVVFPLI